MSSQQRALAVLHRWLLVHQGFVPLAQAFAPAPAMEGLFDACVARWESDDLRVIALFADHGGDSADAGYRAESFRQALTDVQDQCQGRILGGVWTLTDSAERAAELRAVLLKFEDGHFLAKILMGRGVLCVAEGEAVWAGRAPAKPLAQEIAAATAPEIDPGSEAAEGILKAHQAQERDLRRLLRPAPSPATWTLIGLNVMVFVWQVLWFQALDGRVLHSLEEGLAELLRLAALAGPAGMDVLVGMGANSHELTLTQGQLWRLLSSAFLHANALHLGMNMAALFSLGGLLERLVGPWRLVGLYLAAALVSGLLSAFALPLGVNSVGASGAIFGLAGLLLAPKLRRHPAFPESLSHRLFQWLAPPVALTFVLGLALQVQGRSLQIDNAAHLGGLLLGFTLGYLWPSFLVRPTRRKV
jgi:membrane associated rhomboid family serine protease